MPQTAVKSLGILTADEAARSIGVSRPAVYKALREGRIKAHRFGKTYVIFHGEALRYKNSERKPGRPSGSGRHDKNEIRT